MVQARLLRFHILKFTNMENLYELPQLHLNICLYESK